MLFWVFVSDAGFCFVTQAVLELVDSRASVSHVLVLQETPHPALPPSHVPVLLLGGPSLLMVSSLRRPETLLEKSESVAGPSAGILDTSPQFILLA